MHFSDASRVPGGSFSLDNSFLTTLSCSNKRENNKCLLFWITRDLGFTCSKLFSHSPEWESLECYNSKVSFRAHHSLRHSHTNPHIFSRQKRSGQTSFHLFFMQEQLNLYNEIRSRASNSRLSGRATFAGSFEVAFTSLSCGHAVFGGQVVYLEAWWKDVMKWFAASGGLQLDMAQTAACSDRLQSAFWSRRGQTLVSPPVSASLSAPTPLNKLDWSPGQYFLPVWRTTCRKAFV